MMNRILFSTMLMASAGLYSCEGKEGNPRSTPIDSTNTGGTAPVQYNAADTGAMLPDANGEEGPAANTPGGDSVPSTTK